MNNYVVIGRGGAYQGLIEILGTDCCGYYDDAGSENDSNWLGPIKRVGEFKHAHFLALAAIRNMRLRATLIDRMPRDSQRVAVSKAAHIAPTVSIGGGSIVFGTTSIGSNSTLHPHCIVFSGVVIEHDALIGTNVNIGPGAVLAGKVRIDDHVFIGAGAVLTDGVRVGRGSVVGAGSLVLRDVPAGVIAYGTPARAMRQNDIFGQVP